MELKFRFDQLLDRKKEEENRKEETDVTPPAKDTEEALRKEKIEMLNKWLEELKKKRPSQSNPDD